MLKQWMHAIRWPKVIWKINQITLQIYTFLDLFISNTLRSILRKSVTFWPTDYLCTLLYVNKLNFESWFIYKKPRLRNKNWHLLLKGDSREKGFLWLNMITRFFCLQQFVFFFFQFEIKAAPTKTILFTKNRYSKTFSTKHSIHLHLKWSKSFFLVLDTRTSTKSHRNVILQAGRDVLLQFILHKMLRRNLH